MTRQIHEREDGFLRAVLDLAGYLGWRRAHFRPARTAHGWRTAMSGDPGWPDVALAKAGQPLILAELKSAYGRVSDDQQTWLDVLGQVDKPLVQLWKPAAWEYIEAILRGGVTHAKRP